MFVVNKMWAAVAASGIVLGAAYMLWLYQRTMFGPVDNPKNEQLADLSMREVATFVPLIILAVWIGLYPSPILRRLESSVTYVIARVNPGVLRRRTRTLTSPLAGRWRRGSSRCRLGFQRLISTTSCRRSC